MSSFLFFFLLFTTTINLRSIGISPDEDLTSYVHVAHGLEVSSQTNTYTCYMEAHPFSSV
jgi:hypothetical protein